MQTRLSEGQFDHVMILGNSLVYRPQSDDDLRIMHEARRLLKPDGHLLLDITDGEGYRFP